MTHYRGHIIEAAGPLRRVLGQPIRWRALWVERVGYAEDERAARVAIDHAVGDPDRTYAAMLERAARQGELGVATPPEGWRAMVRREGVEQ